MKIVVARDKHDRYASLSKIYDTPGELSLVSLGWVFALIGIPTEKDQVCAFRDGIFD